VSVHGQDERRYAPAGDAPVERLTAFIAGDSPSSRQAMRNLTGVLDSLAIPPERLQVVDVLTDPGAALDAGALVTPSLQAVRAGRTRWFLGDLTDQRDLVAFLG
jgi:circadian clock protein KaiB